MVSWCRSELRTQDLQILALDLLQHSSLGLFPPLWLLCSAGRKTELVMQPGFWSWLCCHCLTLGKSPNFLESWKTKRVLRGSQRPLPVLMACGFVLWTLFSFHIPGGGSRAVSSTLDGNEGLKMEPGVVLGLAWTWTVSCKGGRASWRILSGHWGHRPKQESYLQNPVQCKVVISNCSPLYRQQPQASLCFNPAWRNHILSLSEPLMLCLAPSAALPDATQIRFLQLLFCVQ